MEVLPEESVVSAPELPDAGMEPKPAMLAHEPFFKKWGGLFVLSLGLAIVIIDTTLLNVSLSTIIADLHTNLKDIQWVITAYALVLAAFTITGGRLGDLFGRKRMFMLGAIIFAVGSFLASIAHGMTLLLLGESIIEGFGAALMMPATASLVVANFHGPDRSKAFGVWGAVAGASSAVGPLLGGYLTTHYSWRWGFRINVFVAALVIIGSLLLVKESFDERKPSIDWWGVVLSSLGLLGITYGIIESTTYGWWKAKEALVIGSYSLDLWGYSVVPFVIALGVLLIALFLWVENFREAQGKSVLVSSHLFQNRQYAVGTAATAVLTLAMTGQLFALPIFLQAVKNLDAFHTGLAMLPLSATVLVVAPLTGFFAKKIQPRYLIWAGFVIDIIAPFVIASQLRPDMSIGHLIPGLIMYGVGMGLLFPPLSDITLSAVSVEMAGEASGVNNTLRQVGTTLGTALVGAAVLTSLGSMLASGIQASPVIPAQYKQQIAQELSSPNSNAEFGGARAAAYQLPAAVGAEIQQLTYLATTNANKDAYVYAALFAFVGLIVSLFLPKTSIEHHVDGKSVSLEQRPVAAVMYALAVVLVAVAAAGAWKLLKNRDGKVITTGALADTASSIRNAFAQNSDAHNAFDGTVYVQQQTNVPTASPAVSQAVSMVKPAEKISRSGSLRGPDSTSAGRVLGAQTSGVGQQSETVYRSSTLGFEITLPGNWQADQLSSDKVAFLTGTGRQDTVEMYANFTGSLDEIQYQLSENSSAKNVRTGSFQGQPAVLYTALSGQQGAAVVYNGALYYIVAKNLTATPWTTFRFM